MLPFQRTSHLRSLEMLAGHIVVGVCQSRIFVRKNDRTKAWHAWREAHINYLHDCVDPKVLNISVTPKREFVHFEQHSYVSHLNKLTKEDIGQSATWKNWKVLLAGSKLTRTSADLTFADQHMKRALMG